MNSHNIKPEDFERTVCGLERVTFTDDFGNFFSIGDLLQIHVMPFDYVLEGTFKFNTEDFSFYAHTKYGKTPISRKSECQDMGARIIVTKTIKKLAGGSNE